MCNVTAVLSDVNQVNFFLSPDNTLKTAVFENSPASEKVKENQRYEGTSRQQKGVFWSSDF